ncbi:MAG: hypothetical protein BM557_05410 [Flavobacterium sp. MedPE-SWcel]|nr:MAG: hypothetical protein BM557_05410 [Flavobacterium sp. MedPE-SWcel]
MFSNAMVAQRESSTDVVLREGTEKVVNHVVTLGETIALIARKYMVRPSDIYELNPDAVEGVSPGTPLKIPVDRALQVSASKKKKKQYRKKKLLTQNRLKESSSIEVSKSLVKTTPKEKVEVVEAVSDKVSKAVKVVELPEDGVFEVRHKVSSGETLTALTRRYNTTLEAIIAANSVDLRNGLQVGQEVIVPAGPTPETMEGIVIHEVKLGETLIGLSRKYNTTIEAIKKYNKRKLRHGLQTGQKLSIMPGE